MNKNTRAMLVNYLKIAVRNLRRNLSFATLSTLGLSMSIACCVLIFLVVRHHTGIDRFHARADRTVLIATESKGERASWEGNVPYPMGAALRQEYAFLEKTAMVAIRHNSLITIAAPGTAPAMFKEREIRAFAEPELFEIFDFPLAQGSLEGFRQPNTALLTEQYARKYFGTADAVGKTFRVNNNSDYQVVGVLRDIPENTDLRSQVYCSWATLTADTNSRRMLQNWGGIHGGTQCFATLRDGHQRAELESAFAQFREKYFHPQVRELYYHAVPLASVHFNPDLGSGIRESYIWVLALIGLFLLLTACVNFVNMATAQALSRAREVGVRKSLGSTRGQLFWQFMSETGLIVFLSTALGLAGAWLALPALHSLTGIRLAMPLADGAAFYAFLAALMLAVAFLSGAYPGLALSRFRPAESLKGTMEGQRAGGFSLRRVLVGSQFAISQTLIIGVVAVTAQMEFTRRADTGFQRDGIVTMPLAGPFDLAKQHALRQQLESVAGVESVTLCFQPPASDANWLTRLRLEGRTGDEPWETNIKSVDSRFLETFGVSLVAGRNLTPGDTAREILVNEELVRKLGLASPEDILGKRLYQGQENFPVAGVVKNFHNRSFHDPIWPQVMMSDAGNYDACAIRINLQQQKPVMEAVEKIWKGIFPAYFFEYEFMDIRLARFYERETVMLQLLRVFAGIAVFIGCLGLYGLSAFLVQRKRKEIGIRKTLGASVGGVLWLFGKEYARLLILAFVVAAPLGWWAINQWLGNFAFRIQLGAGIFGLALLLTLLVAGLTVGIQSARAALDNPVKSLRSE